jgi:hypothetical protein
MQYYCSECSRTCEDEKNDVKEKFYKEPGRVYNQFLTYDIKIFLVNSM